MRGHIFEGRWLIAATIFLTFCSRGDVPSLTGPSSTGALTAAADGKAGASAVGDVKVGNGVLEIVRLRMTGGNAGGLYVNPNGSYAISKGATIELWAEWDPAGLPRNPRFIVNWGEGEADFTGCGSCKLTHKYNTEALFTVSASLDDLSGTMVTRKFTLDARSPSTPTASPRPALGGTCFSFTNTSAEDLSGVNWFDNCVDTVTTGVRVTLQDSSGNIVYPASGAKVGVWSLNQLTSTADVQNQYYVLSHDRLITLDNGDLLKISGRNSANAGCGGDQGNGYVIMIYESLPSGGYYEGIKLLAAPYQRTEFTHGVGARDFHPWGPEYEISWKGGASDMNSCFGSHGGSGPLVPFQGTFSFSVF